MWTKKARAFVSDKLYHPSLIIRGIDLIKSFWCKVTQAFCKLDHFINKINISLGLVRLG